MITINNGNYYEDAEVTLYPNPAYAEVIINIAGFEGIEGKICLYNSMGQIVYQQDYTSITDNQYIISLNGLSDGLYSLQVSSTKATKTLKLVIVNQ